MRLKNKKKVIFNILKYGFLFLFFLYGLIISYNMFFGDSIANLGFSYAIVKGEVPYNDFNLIIPLFSPLFYAIPLFIYNSAITFYITQAALLTLFFYLLEKDLENKIYIFFMVICFSFPIPLFSALFPGYNFLLFFLIIVLIYLEKMDVNDFFVGFIIGLCIITKHTIGVFLIIPSIIFYYKNPRKLLFRFIGLLIPNLIFLIYLLFTKSFNNFINLCVFGLFDFANKNATYNNLFLIMVAIFCLIYFIYVLFKSKNIKYYYLFFSILFIVPLFDDYHMSYFVLATLYVWLDRCDFSSKNILLLSKVMIFLLVGIWSLICFSVMEYHFINYSYYPFRYMSKGMEDDYKYLDSVLRKYKNVNLFLLGTENYFYKMNNGRKINYYDLPNYGNYGYNSYKMMTKKIENEHDSYFIINALAYNSKTSNQQYYRELVEYIVEYGELIEQKYSYQVYYFK